MKTIYLNQDNHQFYLHPAEDMCEDGCRNLVDYYAGAGTVKGMLFCTNVQMALYDSAVWERFRDKALTARMHRSEMNFFSYYYHP